MRTATNHPPFFNLKDFLTSALHPNPTPHATPCTLQKAVLLLKAADSVVRTFQRTKLWRDAPTQYKGQVMPAALQELLSQPVLLPSPFLEQVAAGFADQASEFKKTVGELEGALAAAAARQAEAAAGGAGGVDAARALPTVVGNMHDYFTHVAAKLERAHGEVRCWSARNALGRLGFLVQVLPPQIRLPSADSLKQAALF